MIEEKTCPRCGEPYEGSLVQHLMKTCKSVEVKMEEFIRLTNSRVRELEKFLAASADREQSLMLQLAEAEKERDSLNGQLQKTQQQLKESTQVSIKLALQKGGQVDEMRGLRTRLAEVADREQSLILQLGERDNHLAKAEESIRKANVTIEYQSNRFKKFEKRAHDAEAELRATKKRVNSVYEDEVKIVKTVCHNILKEPLFGDKLQEVVIFHLKNYKSNLEAALREETEK